MGFWILVGVGVLGIAVSIIAHYIEDGRRPQCPLHPGRSMELVEEVMGNEEFVCRTEGCTQCATRYCDGNVRRYTT